MPRPFRFGVQLSSLPRDGWVERVERLEALGYSTLFCPDHFTSQWDPTSLLAAAAAVTHRIRLGSLVYGIDYRHPVIYAKQAATLHLLSGGRHEFGLGAGWMESDYQQAGMSYDRPGVRIERLAEALQVIRAMWEGDGSSFEGRHYQIREIPRAAELGPGERPWILVGGGGPRLLALAGRHADIVGINPQLTEGRVTSETPADLAPERVREKVRWVRDAAEAAGRNPDEIELNSLSFVVAITDDPKGIRNALARGTGMSAEQVADCPLFLTGSASEIRERLEKRREETGISYVVIQGREWEQVEDFAEAVVAPLAGR
jgi:probable F420-dependent oxidoreductase